MTPSNIKSQIEETIKRLNHEHGKIKHPTCYTQRCDICEELEIQQAKLEGIKIGEQMGKEKDILDDLFVEIAKPVVSLTKEEMNKLFTKWRLQGKREGEQKALSLKEQEDKKYMEDYQEAAYQRGREQAKQEGRTEREKEIKGIIKKKIKAIQEQYKYETHDKYYLEFAECLFKEVEFELTSKIKEKEKGDK